MKANCIEKKINETGTGNLLLIQTDKESYILSVHKGMFDLFYGYPVIEKQEFDKFKQESRESSSARHFLNEHFKDMYLFANDNRNELHLKYFKDIKKDGYIATENETMGEIISVEIYQQDRDILKKMDDVYQTYLIGTENMSREEILDRALHQFPDDMWVSNPSIRAS